MRKPLVVTFLNDDKIDPDVCLLAKLCYANGVDYAICLFADVDFDDGVLDAFVWTPDGLVREKVGFPTYAECMSCDEQMRDAISHHSKVLDDYALSKKEISDLLLTSEFAENIIPTLHTHNPHRILEFAKMFPEIIVKPIRGARGEGIVCIKPQVDSFAFSLVDSSEFVLDGDGGVKKLSELFGGLTVIVQPRMNFRSKSGAMMDFRINVAKNGNGQWQKVFAIARTNPTGIVSNLSTGGYATDGGAALLCEFGDDAVSISEKLIRISTEVPVIVEKASKCHMLTMGIDVAIDRDSLTPYIIEVNYVPQVHFHKDAYNGAKADYFRYLSKQE